MLPIRNESSGFFVYFSTIHITYFGLKSMSNARTRKYTTVHKRSNFGTAIIYVLLKNKNKF